MNVRRVSAAAFALVIGFGIGTVAIEADGLRTLFRSGELLGTLDMFRFCDTRYGESASASLAGDDAYSWQCVVRKPIFATKAIDVDDACSEQWGVPARAHTSDPDQPYSWECYVR